jgi:hypothetical protein
MKIARHIVLLFLVTVSLSVPAQVSVNFSPSIFGQSMEGLGMAQLLNVYSTPKQANVTIVVTHLALGNIVTIRTPDFVLKPGINPINRVEYSKSSILFGTSTIAQQVKQTGRFAEGEYEICYTVLAGEKAGIFETFENCFTSLIQPATPLLLITPIDGDDICNTRPQFVWQPPMPLTREMRFGLQLCELKEKQSREAAMVNNLPLIAQYNIPGSSLLYPPAIKELSKDKKYVWQVTVYSGKTILSKSEIWDFKVDCKEEVPRPPTTESYRELKETDNGNYYIARNVLRISLHNPYSQGNLNYSIVSLAEPGKPIKKLPELKLNPGLNMYDIDLTTNNAFKMGEEYLITVYLKNDRIFRLRFIYKTEE